MTDKEFRVRNGLIVGNNVLVANVTSNTLTVDGIINAAVIQVNGTTIPSGAVSNLIFNTANAAFDKANTAASDLANTAIAANNYAGVMANSANAIAAATYATSTNATAAFAKANSALANASGTFAGTLSVTGNVGIGTSSPSTNLEIVSPDIAQARLRASTNGIDCRLSSLGLTGNAGQVGTWSNHPFVIRTNDAERMRITNAGGVGIGTTSIGGFSGTVSLGGSGNPDSGYLEGYGNIQIVPSSVTTRFDAYLSAPNTIAASFTLPNFSHFRAQQGTFGAGSTVTNQYGFWAEGLISATNNYGFYSNIASGTGRWNFYANGTADNFFLGRTGIGTVPDGDAALHIRQTDTNYRLTLDYFSNTAINSPNIKFYRARASSGDIQNGDRLGQIIFQGKAGGTFPFGAVIAAEVDGSPGASDLPTRLMFLTTSDGSSSPAERLRITNDGNVGIGTSSPADKLTISGAAGSAIYESITNGANTFLLGLSAGNIPLFGTTSNDPLLIYTNNTERMRIDSSGNIGIGSGTTSSWRIRVDSSNVYGSALYVAASNTNFPIVGTLRYRDSNATVQNGDVLGRLQFLGSNVTGFGSAMIDGIATGTISSSALPTSIVFYTAPDGSINATERLRITSSGGVGIGVSNPGSTLEVGGHTDVTTNSIAGFGLRIRTPSGSGSAGILQFTNNPVTAQWATISSPGANIISLNDGGGIPMLYASGGNVGIGTTSTNPIGTSRNISVYGSSTASITLGTTSGSATFYSSDGTSYAQIMNPGTVPFIIGTNNTERMRIDSSGRVGIGKVPSVTFETQAATNATDGPYSAAFVSQYDRQGNAATRRLLLTSDNFRSTIQSQYLDGSLNWIANDLLLNTDGGNVGIGTTSPTSILDVRGGNGTGGISGPSSGTWASKIVMNQDGGSLCGLSVQSRWGTSSSVIFEAAAGWNGSSAGYYPVFSVLGDSTTIFKSASTEKMRIAASGNVAIGTSSSNDSRLTIQRQSGISSNPELLISDGTQWVRFNSNTAPGSWNSIVQNRDAQIIYSQGTQNTGGFVIGPWFGSVTPVGLRLNANGNMSIGTAGGDYAREWNLVVRRDQNDATQFGIINANTTGSLARLSKITFTGNSFLNWDLNDNSGNPFDNFAYGSAIQSVRWSFGGNERVRIANTGNVGIGTTTPGYTLDVNGTAKSNNFRLDSGSVSATLAIWNGAGYYGGFGTEAALTNSGSSTNIGIRADTNRDIIFYAGGINERVRILSGGNVAIGRTTADYRLDVNGSVNAAAILVNGVAVGGSSGSLLRVTSFTSSSTWTKGSGTKYVLVYVVGGGGGAYVAGGGGGGASIGFLDVTSISSVSVTIGSGGNGTNGSTPGAGGTSSFGTYFIGNGGSSTLNIDTSAAGGTASGGFTQITGQAGTPGMVIASTSRAGFGGNSLLGFGGRPGFGTPPAATGYGGGGGGTTGATGGSGTAGIVIVYEFA